MIDPDHEIQKDSKKCAICTHTFLRYLFMFVIFWDTLGSSEKLKAFTSSGNVKDYLGYMIQIVYKSLEWFHVVRLRLDGSQTLLDLF